MMKTKLFIPVFLLVFGFACSSGGNESQEGADSTAMETPEGASEEAVSKTVVLEDSHVIWRGEVLGVYEHTGTVKIQEADLMMAGSTVKGGSFTIDMSSITPTDENYKEEEGRTSQDLVNHLSSDDFFGVETYPTSKFVITEVNGDMVTGDLTIRDVTESATIKNVKVEEEGDAMKITGDITIDRKKYNVAFVHPAQDIVISDDVELSVMLTAK